MQTTALAPQDQPLNLLADWISREQLAGELGLACDTLAHGLGPVDLAANGPVPTPGTDVLV